MRRRGAKSFIYINICQGILSIYAVMDGERARQVGALDAHLAGGARGDERHGQPVALPALQVEFAARRRPMRAIAAWRCGSALCPVINPVHA